MFAYNQKFVCDGKMFPMTNFQNCLKNKMNLDIKSLRGELAAKNYTYHIPMYFTVVSYVN